MNSNFQEIVQPPDPDIEVWLCEYGDCKNLAECQDVESEINVCFEHMDHDFIMSIKNETDHIPTFQNMLLKGLKDG